MDKKKSFVVLPSRIINALTRNGINCLEDLDGYPEKKVKKFRHLGKQSVGILKKSMKEHGFSLDDSKFTRAFPIYKESEPSDV